MIPYSYNMVDMGGIDLAEANGTVVPGVYEKIVEAMNLCGDLIIYNWKFSEIEIAPSAYSVLQQGSSIMINGSIQVTELDQVTVISLPPPIVPVSPLEVTENGVYEVEPPASGFNPVIVNVDTDSNTISGTGDPLASQGEDGQIYLKYLGVPSGYTLLESLSVTEAGPYIDTKVINSAAAYFEVESKWDSAPSNNSAIFGAQTTVEFSVNAWQGSSFIAAGSSHFNISDPLQRHILLATLDGLYIDGVRGSSNVNWNSATNRDYFLFANNYSGGVLKSSNATVYHCRIYNGSNIVRDMYPAIRNSDSVLGMIDLINGTFYENVGTGSFIAGGQSPLMDEPIVAAFCKVDGVWQPLIGTPIDDVSL